MKFLTGLIIGMIVTVLVMDRPVVNLTVTRCYEVEEWFDGDIWQRAYLIEGTWYYAKPTVNGSYEIVGRLDRFYR